MRKHWATLGLVAVTALTASASRAQFTNHWVTTLPFHQRLDAPPGSPATPDDDIRGIAFNRNPGSRYYGYAYVCFRSTPARPNVPGVAYEKILIYRPDSAAAARDVPSYEDTGLSIIVPGQPANGVFGVDIGSDDTVWIADYGARKIWQAPAVPSSGSQATATPIINLPDYDATATPMLPAGVTALGKPRGIVVSGTAANAIVVVCNNESGTKRSIEKFTVSGSTVTFNWAYAPQNVTGNTYAQGNSCVDAAIDAAGNVYVPLAARGDQGTQDVTIVKLLGATGTPDPTFAPTTPVNAGPADYPAIAYVPNTTAPGGGYLFWQGARAGSNNSINAANVYQYDMTGTMVDYYGVDASGNPLGLGKKILGFNIVEVFSADEAGNLYQRYGTGTANANIYRISQSPPAINAGDYKKSAPTVFDGIVYFGSGDGNLYAVDAATGVTVPGFPVDIAALTGDTGATVLGRPSVRIAGGAIPYVYVATTTGRVVRLPLTGTLGLGEWRSIPLVTATDVKVTPAVTDTGVYVAMADGATATLAKLDLNTGVKLYDLTLSGATKVLSSVSVYNGNIYVATDAGVFRVTDDGSALIVQASNITGNTPGSPFVDAAAPGSPTMYAVDTTGMVYANNATNFNPVATFGSGGVVQLVNDDSITPTVSTGPYALLGKVYVGANDNKVYVLNEADGAGANGGSMVFFDANEVGIPVTELSPGGWRITSDVSAATNALGEWNIVFGSRSGLYYQVNADYPGDYHVTVVGNVNRYAVDSPPAIDRTTGSEFVGVDSGFIMKVPAFVHTPR